MKVTIIPEGVVFKQDPSRLTAMLLVPFYSFWQRYETRRAGCPIGLEMLAAELVAKGFNVIYLDACMAAYNQFTMQPEGTCRYGLTDQQLEKALVKFKPDLVGITSMFSNQASNVQRVARLVNEVHPKAIIVEGGSNASGDVDRVLEDTWVDMVIREEGLVTLPELCSSIEAGKSSSSCTSVEGVSYKDVNGRLVHNSSRPFVRDLDNLAPRRLEISLHEMYDTPEHTGGSRHRTTGRHVYMLSSMGCPLKCEFCHIHIMAGGIRYFSLDRFEDEVISLKEAGVNEVVLEDDMLFGDVHRAIAVGEILHRHGMVWFEEGGLSMFKFMKPGRDLTYELVLQRLAETGCYRFYLAIESANPESLIRSHKPHINTQGDMAEAIVRYAAAQGIEAVGGFMLGFKGNGDGFEESLEDMERTVNYAKRLKDAGLAYVMLFIYTAIPGTKVYKYLSAQFPDYDLRTSHERAAFPVGGMTTKELTERRREWMAEVNGESCMHIADNTNNWGL